VEATLIWVVILFAIVLLHEFGHCFAARHEGGSAEEILMWPLGGLAYCEVPHVPRANFVTAAGGPFVNVLICIVCALALLPFQLLPPLNPFNFEHVYRPQLHNWSDGDTYYKEKQRLFVRKGTNEVIEFRNIDSYFPYKDEWFAKQDGSKEPIAVSVRESNHHYNAFVLWTARVFWLSWFLFLFNLIPAFPLDGGRLLQSLIWGRTGDYRRGTLAAVYTGFVVALLFMVVALWVIDPILMFMCVFIYFTCRQQYIALEMAENESVFGYDFSQGYTSLEKDEPPPPKLKKQGPIKRWLQARRERKALLEAEQRAADETRMDELLDKIHRQGKESLSDEERHFMSRVSARYRNRS
jgi:Zn-dependent protease